jgi:hypothetical protein
VVIFNFRPRSEVQDFWNGYVDTKWTNYYTGSHFNLRSSDLSSWAPFLPKWLIFTVAFVVEIIPEGPIPISAYVISVAPSVQLRSCVWSRFVPLESTHTHTRAYRRLLFARRPPPRIFPDLEDVFQGVRHAKFEARPALAKMHASLFDVDRDPPTVVATATSCVCAESSPAADSNHTEKFVES